MQSTRRATPYPWTWEVPLAATAAVLLLLVLAAHLARTLANGAAGAGWELTPRAELFTSLPGLLAGDARAGLAQGPAATPAALHAWLVALEAITLAGAIAAAAAGLRRWGPARMRGMATRAEAESLLGLRRLRQVAPLIRPDRYRPGGRR